MRHYVQIYVIVNLTIALALIWMASLVSKLYLRRYEAFEQSWVAVPVITCLILNAAQHAAFVVNIFYRIPLPVLVIQGIYATTCVAAALAGKMMYAKLATAPSPKELKRTNDALATTISHLTEGK